MHAYRARCRLCPLEVASVSYETLTYGIKMQFAPHIRPQQSSGAYVEEFVRQVPQVHSSFAHLPAGSAYHGPAVSTSALDLQDGVGPRALAKGTSAVLPGLEHLSRDYFGTRVSLKWLSKRAGGESRYLFMVELILAKPPESPLVIDSSKLTLGQPQPAGHQSPRSGKCGA